MVDVSSILFAALNAFLHMDEVFYLIMISVLVFSLFAIEESARTFHDTIVGQIRIIFGAGGMSIDILIV